jgi:Heterokaryon incompatibility protein (HET)
MHGVCLAACGKTFWADKICIYHEDEGETHQVAFIEGMYKNASRVITHPDHVGKEEDEHQGWNYPSRWPATSRLITNCCLRGGISPNHRRGGEVVVENIHSRS